MFFSALAKAEAFRQFSRYLIVGGTGFLIDAIGMEVFLKLGLHIMEARACSMTLAMVAAYFLHRAFTFRGSAAAAAPVSQRQFGLYVLCQLTAAAFNYGVFATVLYFIMPQPPGFSARMFSLCAGVGVGLFFNFTLLRYVVFSGGEKKFLEDIKKLKAFVLLHKRLWVWGALIFSFFVISLEWYLAVSVFSNIRMPLEMHETDIWMRMVQVRHWMNGAGFFNHEVVGTNAPFGGVDSHWTRPMDFLIYLFSHLVPHARDASIDFRLLLAGTWLPLCLFGVAIAFLSAAGMRLFNSGHVLLIVALLFCLNPIASNYFSPGNVDHHGLLIMLWCGVLFCIARPLTPVTSIVAGTLLGLMVWVGIESLVIMSLTFGALGLYIAYSRPPEMPLLARMAWMTALTATFGICFEIPADKIFNTVIYDNISIVYLTVLYAVAIGASVLAAAFIYKPNMSLEWRIAVAAVVFLFAAGAVIYLYPAILKGPLVDTTDIIRNHFVKSINEVRPLLKGGFKNVLVRLYLPIIAIALLLGALSRGSVKEDKRRFAAILLMLLPPIISLVFYQMRWNYYLQPVAILAIAIFLPAVAVRARGKTFGWLRYLPRHGRPHFWIWALFLLLSLTFLAMPVGKKRDSYVSTCAIHIFQAIQSGSLEKALGPDNLVLLVHPNFAGEVQFFTPYRVLAGNYHREGEGMLDWKKAYSAHKRSQTWRIIKKRKIDAIYICPSDINKRSWMSKLKPGSSTPSWMKEVTGIEYLPELSARMKKTQDSEKKNKDDRYDMPLLYKIRR